MGWQRAGSSRSEEQELQWLHALSTLEPELLLDTESLGWGLWRNCSILKTLAVPSLLVRALTLPSPSPCSHCTPMGLVLGGDSFVLTPALLGGEVPAAAALEILSPCFCAPWPPWDKDSFWLLSCSFLHSSTDLGTVGQ